jgi:hypothetical protein
MVLFVASDGELYAHEIRHSPYQDNEDEILVRVEEPSS